MRKRVLISFAIAFSACLGSAFAASPASRPATWAAAVSSVKVENFYRVEPDFYRSARPTAEGFRNLASLGVKSILDLEGGGDDQAAHGVAIKLFHLPMTAFGLRDDRVLEALRILADPKNRPIVVHCHLGADRTGAMVALYRVVVQGWSKEDAIREMDDGGYHHSSFWRNLDRYVARANVDALRKQLGIVTPAPILAAALASAPSGIITTGVAVSAAEAPRAANSAATLAAAPANERP